MGKPKGLVERLAAGETIVVAEGYAFELESRGYLKAGAFVPEVVLDKPEIVRQLHQEFVHAGSDVVLALLYYGHKEKLRVVGREADQEALNRNALKIAREVADETGTLMAGNICNSTIFKPNDPDNHKEIYDMFSQTVKWSVEAGADFIVAETYDSVEEAKIALKAVKDHGKGIPAVVTYSVPASGKTSCGLSPAEACRALEEAGAAVVGLNCGHGPATILPIIKAVRQACKGPIAALPVAFRTSEETPHFYGLRDIDNPEEQAFPLDIAPYACGRSQISKFATEAKALGVQYIGLCCGNKSNLMRSMAEAVGKTPTATRYSPDMSQHYSRLKDDRHTHTQGGFADLYFNR